MRHLQTREIVALAPVLQDFDELERSSPKRGTASRAQAASDSLVVVIAGRAVGTAEGGGVLHEAANDHLPPLLLRLRCRFDGLDALLQATLDDVGGVLRQRVEDVNEVDRPAALG